MENRCVCGYCREVEEHLQAVLKTKGVQSFIRCYIVEPEAAAIYAGKPTLNEGRHKIQGCGYNMILPLIDETLIDGCSGDR